MDKSELENGVKDLAARTSAIYSQAAKKVDTLGKSSDVSSAVKDIHTAATETTDLVAKVLNAMDALLAK